VVSLSASSQSVRLASHFVAKAGCAARELRLGRPPCDHLGKDSRKADVILAPNQNIESNPMKSNRGGVGMDALPAKTF